MSMTETPTESPKSKPARKPAKKRARRQSIAAPKPPVPPAEFEGLSPTECCNGCNAEKCVISGINVCSHPMKGGLQSTQLGQQEVVKRYGRAKAALRDAIIDLRARG
jgi:hypothetical protein